MFHAERAIQMHADHADFFAASVEVSRRLFGSLATGTDSDNDSFGVGRTEIIENVMFASRNFRHVRHNFFDNVGQVFVSVVDRFANLEVNVGICRRAANDGMIRI